MAWAIGLSTPINLLAQFTDIASVCPLRPVKCRNYFYNRGNFEIFAYSNSTDDGSPMRRRIASAFDKFFDIRGIPDKIAADMIHADGIDILVGLKGYTTDDRGPILAYRPAPVQAQFLGYPGTMGTASVDYLIAVRRNLPSNWDCNLTR